MLTPPLSADQVRDAVQFGISRYGRPELILDYEDPYDVEIAGDNIGLSVVTLFRRIAIYVGECVLSNQVPNELKIAAISQLRAYPEHHESYGIEMFSPHEKTLLFARDLASDDSMLSVEVTPAIGNMKREGWIPYPTRKDSICEFRLEFFEAKSKRVRVIEDILFNFGLVS